MQQHHIPNFGLKALLPAISKFYYFSDDLTVVTGYSRCTGSISGKVPGILPVKGLFKQVLVYARTILRAYTSIISIKKLLFVKVRSFYPIHIGCPYMPVKILHKMIRYFSCYSN